MAEFKPDAKSADYEAMEPMWTMAADLLEGAEAVRAGGEAYLPRLPDEDYTAYDYRRRTAKYVNIFGDIVTNLAAKPFRKELVLKDGSASPRLAELAEDIDGRGNNLHVFAAETFFNGIAFAVDWIWVDHTKAKPNEDGRPLTLADEKAQGLRPYWVRVPAKNMLAVDSASVGGREQIVHARFLENVAERDGFTERRFRRVRIVDRTRNGDGSYGPPIYQVWDEVTGQGRKATWKLADSGIMTIGIIPLVPFIAGRRKGGSWQFTPPLKDAAYLQVEHYQQEASLKAIKELTAFPMLAGLGVSPETANGKPKQLRVGPRSVLYAPPGADGKPGDWKFVEPAGNSLSFLAEQIKATEEQLRELGQQPLTAQTGNLTVVTTAFAASKANSVISAWALNLKDALERALQITALWLSDTSQPKVQIEADFDVALHGDKDLSALGEARKAGDISRATYWDEMKRRGVLSADFDAEAERERLIEEMDDPLDDNEAGAAIVPFPNAAAQ